jgi:hypothetical protein
VHMTRDVHTVVCVHAYFRVCISVVFVNMIVVWCDVCMAAVVCSSGAYVRACLFILVEICICVGIHVRTHFLECRQHKWQRLHQVVYTQYGQLHEAMLGNGIYMCAEEVS